jgi:hypothetical protein
MIQADCAWSKQTVYGPSRLCMIRADCAWSKQTVYGPGRLCMVQADCVGSKQDCVGSGQTTYHRALQVAQTTLSSVLFKTITKICSAEAKLCVIIHCNRPRTLCQHVPSPACASATHVQLCIGRAAKYHQSLQVSPYGSQLSNTPMGIEQKATCPLSDTCRTQEGGCWGLHNALYIKIWEWRAAMALSKIALLLMTGPRIRRLLHDLQANNSSVY